MCDALPDEILTRIFALLSPFEVMYTVPLVCKRWRDLHMIPHIWREMELFSDDVNQAALTGLLHFAPAFRLVDISGLHSVKDHLAARRAFVSGSAKVEVFRTHCLAPYDVFLEVDAVSFPNTETIREIELDPSDSGNRRVRRLELAVCPMMAAAVEDRYVCHTWHNTEADFDWMVPTDDPEIALVDDLSWCASCTRNYINFILTLVDRRGPVSVRKLSMSWMGLVPSHVAGHVLTFTNMREVTLRVESIDLIKNMNHLEKLTILENPYMFITSSNWVVDNLPSLAGPLGSIRKLCIWQPEGRPFSPRYRRINSLLPIISRYCVNVRELHLDGYFFSNQKIREMLETLPHLEKLTFYSGAPRKILGELRNLSNLKQLDLSSFIIPRYSEDREVLQELLKSNPQLEVKSRIRV